jgi:glycosyltransferase involved in cell wall biosynthesis
MPRSGKPLDRPAWRRHWGADESQLVLAYFGFVNQSKGGEELIEALAKLVDEGREVRLLMIGGRVGASDPTNLAYLHRVQGLIADRNLTRRVVWTDYLPLDEATATLMASDICVLPYRDGVSTRRGALMAALAHGLPVVTTTPRVPLTQFRDGENMLLVPPQDPDALAAGIARLADDVELRRQIGAGAELLARQFTWPAIAESTLAFFAELTSS